MARYLALGEASHLQRATVLEPVDPEPFPASEAAQAPAGDLIEQVIAQALPLPVARQRVVEEFERRYIERVLAEHGGNVARAANASGIARRYFQILKARKRT